jgi:hypothetical protein
MAEAEKARWERVLRKFSMSELPKIAERHLGLEVLPKAQNRKELVALLVTSCLERELTPADLLSLELYCRSSQSFTRTECLYAWLLLFRFHKEVCELCPVESVQATVC